MQLSCSGGGDCGSGFFNYILHDHHLHHHHRAWSHSPLKLPTYYANAMIDIIIIIIVIINITFTIQDDHGPLQASLPTTPWWRRLPDGSDAHQGGPTQPASGFQR